MPVHVFTKQTYYRIGIVLMLLCMPLMGWGEGLTGPLEEKLKNSPPRTEIGVIILLKDQAQLSVPADKPRQLRRLLMIKNLRNKAKAAQVPLKAWLRKKGAKSGTTLWLRNGLAVELTPAVIRELAGQPFIESIGPDETVALPALQPAFPSYVEGNITRIRAPELWALGYTGQGVVIASLDTGVDVLHADLAEKWRGGTNSWFDPHYQHATPYDRNGHGTQVMGVMVGGDRSGSAIGAAFGSRWIAVKIYSDTGVCRYSHIHAGLQWLLDPDGNPATDDAPDIVNNSWGLDGQPNRYLPEFQEDFRILKAAGMAIVCSAGNAGPAVASSVSPANYPESLSAGATDWYDYPAYFSSRGPSACDGSIFPLLVAPGVDILTTDLTMRGFFPYAYTYVSGTSLSAGQVTGALALLLSAFPECTVTELEQALLQTADDLGFPGPDNDTGYGMLDVYAAYNRLKTAHAD